MSDINPGLQQFMQNSGGSAGGGGAASGGGKAPAEDHFEAIKQAAEAWLVKICTVFGINISTDNASTLPEFSGAAPIKSDGPVLAGGALGVLKDVEGHGLGGAALAQLAKRFKHSHTDHTQMIAGTGLHVNEGNLGGFSPGAGGGGASAGGGIEI